MKVEINTKDKSVWVSANDIATDLAVLDRWVAALRIARRWLKRELEKKS